MSSENISISIKMKGENVKLLQDKLERLGYVIPSDERTKKLFGPRTKKAIVDFQKKSNLKDTGIVDPSTGATLENAAAAVKLEKRKIEGRVYFEHGLPAGNIPIRLYRQSVGGVEALLGEGKTDDQGNYAVEYELPGDAINVEARTMDARRKEIPISGTKFNIQKQETLNLIVPASLRPLSSEYQRIKSDMEKQLGTLSALAKVREGGKRHDLTMLRQSTGWDARIVTLLAEAVKLSPVTGLQLETVYGLLRLGFPSERQMLAMASPEGVEAALKKAKEAGILSPAFSVETAKRDFVAFRKGTLRKMRVAGTLSTFDEMLSVSGLSDGEKESFLDLYFSFEGSSSEFWEKAKGIVHEKTDSIRLQGKIAYLTRNNAAVTSALHAKIGLTENLSQLVGQGADTKNDFYKSASWKQLINDVAKEKKKSVKSLIPPDYIGDEQTQLDAYAADLARKVRLSFPTRVVKRMIENSELPIGKADTKPALTGFLDKAEKLGFKLGQVPVGAFLEKHKDTLLPPNLSEEAKQRTKEDLKTLARLYQITPSNEALKVLLEHGFKSAFDVVAYPQEQFVKTFGDKFPTLEQGKQIYNKSQQVTMVTYSFFSTAQLVNNSPPIQAISAPAAERQIVKDGLIRQFPTMQSLFGSLDYCECPHCRSALSPAAYLVDLFEFLNPDDSVWEDTITASPRKDEYYWYINPETGKPMKPFDVLAEKRPDLHNLPLTCENTNTVLPYIDIANEILEYYVAHNSIKDYEGYDTGKATTPELLAEPQNVLPKAYDVLRLARYPLALPFDLWLSSARLFFDHFESPLSQVLEIFRRSEDLFATQQLTIGNPTNVDNATFVVSNAEANRLRTGDVVTFFDITAGQLSTETKTLSKVGPDNSGGAGNSVVTLRGLWSTPPDAGDKLVVRSNYGWAHIFCEKLGLSPAEYEIFTNSNPLLNWQELYGYATAKPAIENPTNPASSLNATVTLGNEDAAKFRDGDFVTYFDSATGALSTETNEIISIGQPSSAGNGKTLITLRKWGTAPKPGDLLVCDALSALKFAKTLAGRLGVSYKELAEIIQTGFVNPELDKLIIVWKLGLSASDIVGYFDNLNNPDYADEKQAINDRLDNFDAEHNLNKGFSLTKLKNIWPDTFKKTLLLRDPSPLGNFDLTVVEHAVLGGTEQEKSAQKEDFKLALLKINLLVRLQRKLGWTIEETARALQVFFPQQLPTVTDAGFGIAFSSAFKPALMYMAHLQSLDGPLKVGKNSRLKLLTLWSKIMTTGKNPLYAQLFLTASILKNDPAFDDPMGEYLTKGDLFVRDHLPALQAALNLTGDEIQEVLEDNGKSIDEKLSLETASLLYRYWLLGKGLKLSIRDLISLKRLSGLNPFDTPKTGPLTAVSDDYPFTKTICFVEIAEEVKKSGFTIEDLDFLFGHRFDPVGKFRAVSQVNWTLLKATTAEVKRVTEEHQIPETKEATTDDFLRQKLALVFPADVVDKFFGFWNDTITFSSEKSPVKEEERLNPAIYEVEGVRVSYDARARAQKQYVTYTGVLTDDRKKLILGKISKPDAAAPAEQQTAYQNFVSLVNEIATSSQPQPKEFIDKHFEGFLKYDDVFGTAMAALSKDEKRNKFLVAVLPFVQKRLIRQFIVQASAAALNADLGLTELLLTGRKAPAVNQLGDPLIEEPDQTKQTLFDAFAAVDQRGISLTFFDATGAPTGKTMTVQNADTSIKTGSKPLKPAGAMTARFEGYIEVPATGVYSFFATFTTSDVKAELRFQHLPNPLIQRDATRSNGVANSFIELKAGIPYEFVFEAYELQKGDASLLIQGETLPKNSLSKVVLYPATVVNRFRNAHVLLAKTLRIIQTFGFSEREVTYILSHPEDFGDIDVSKIPTAKEALAAESTKLFSQFLLLASYSGLKSSLSAGTDDLVCVFENAEKTYPEIADSEEAVTAHLKLLANLTRRESETVRATAETLGYKLNATPEGTGYRVKSLDLCDIKKLWRLWKALNIVEKLGVPVEKIAGWATPEPDCAVAQSLRDTVNARYEPESWQQIAKSIFDKLRQRKRDALVVHIMYQTSFERIEQLYEHFLIDPGMEPVVQTSRLRLAIASTQLFIQRCLLNLEEKVHPSDIDSKRWRWMKRYRIWEANRKIFLFPENWLEPEFRDDKTHLFQELESALLQGDVSNDLAEDAFFNYLRKLEELAQLDIVTMYSEEKADSAQNTLHVIGRTFNLPHKYFYRRYAHQMWTPWEPVTAEVEGDHVVAVVWRDRLHLFWLTFLEKPKQQDNSDKSFQDMGSAKIPKDTPRDVEIQLNWSEYFQGQWTTPEATGFGNPIKKHFPVGEEFKKQDVFIFASLLDDDSLLINLDGPINQAFHVISKHVPPQPASSATLSDPVYSCNEVPIKCTNRYVGKGKLSVRFTRRLETENDKFSAAETPSVDIVTAIDKETPFQLLLPSRLRGILDELNTIEYQTQWALSCFSKAPTVLDALNKLISFVESLPVQFLNSSINSQVFIANEWATLRKDIVEKVQNATGSQACVDCLSECILDPLDAFLSGTTPESEKSKVVEASKSETKNLVHPFFYMDGHNTFFVEPTMIETTIQEWEGWAVAADLKNVTIGPVDLADLPVYAAVPMPKPGPPVEFVDPTALFTFKEKKDWVIDPATVLVFEKTVVGQEGGLKMEFLSSATKAAEVATTVRVNSSSELLKSATVAFSGGMKAETGGYLVGSREMNIVGSNGVGPNMIKSFAKRQGGL